MTTATAAPRLFSGRHLPLALGVIGLVTLSALENRAVGTALPTMVREFDALGSFGLANAAPNASFVFSIAVAGLWSDRHGPVRTLRLGAIVFGLAQLLIGFAVAMPMVIAGRVLSGIAEGLLDVSLIVLVARALPVVLRPRMMSLISAMWVLPSIFGPLLTGVITEQFGWRWVFLGAVVLLIPTWLLIRPAIRQSQDADVPERTAEHAADLTASRTALPWAAAISLALFTLTLTGDHVGAHRFIGTTVMVVALVVLAGAAVQVMPPGVFVAGRGFPAVVATRALGGAAFTGVGVYLPLLLTLQHNFSPSRAGVSLSVTGVFWALGSWLYGRQHGFQPVTVLRTGLTLLVVGIAVTSLLAWTDTSVWFGLAGWAIASIGMGLTWSSVSVLTLDLSDATNSGRNAGASQMAPAMSIAAVVAITGTLLALKAEDPQPWVFGVIVSAGAVIATLALFTAGRVRQKV
ncbi:MFS transporter [Kribbella antibiotica]|uniref:MFS transporter n=1 Tax=Kribbella antibiotica TaxID=190195 RepID=A0A4R4ZBB6_9ACTN|nr:MFS transporter [Kribbella antibiotica]TDD54674.1 MFS transporter [Kribbella antibiotica]